ncbi:hypothetical protein Tco_0864310 [Tanacetum coccineum]
MEESKDVTSLSLDKLIGNLNVHGVIIKKDCEIVKGEREQMRSLSLKAKRNLVMKKVRRPGVKMKNTPWRLETLRNFSKTEFVGNEDMNVLEVEERMKVLQSIRIDQEGQSLQRNESSSDDLKSANRHANLNITELSHHLKMILEKDRGNDEVEITDEKSSDSDDEDEVAKIFRIDNNVFDFETPIMKMCHGYMKDHRRIMEHGKNPLQLDIIVGEEDKFENTNHDNNECEYEMEHEDEERCELFDDQKRSVCYIRRFKMVKYSFRDDEEYVAIKEDEYDDLTNTSKEAIHTY